MNGNGSEMNRNDSEKMVLLFEASVTTANRRAYDGVYRYAEEARWNVRSIEYSLAAAVRVTFAEGACRSCGRTSAARSRPSESGPARTGSSFRMRPSTGWAWN